MQYGQNENIDDRSCQRHRSSIARPLCECPKLGIHQFASFLKIPKRTVIDSPEVSAEEWVYEKGSEKDIEEAII